MCGMGLTSVRAFDVQQIGRELGVRYVVEGSVRRAWRTGSSTSMRASGMSALFAGRRRVARVHI